MRSCCRTHLFELLIVPNFLGVMFCCVFDLLSCCVKNDLYGVLGDLGNPLQIWNGGDYRESSPCTTKDCSIYGASVPPTSVGVTDGYEHSGFYVRRSIVILLFSGMLVSIGLLGKPL